MEDSVRKALERPFPKDLHRTRKGSFGKQLTYVETVHFIQRLNEAFAGDWSFNVIEHRILDAEVVVLGKLTASGVEKSAFGGSSITVAKESGEPMSVSDDLKAAASDALKKCSSLLGLGQNLYGMGDDAQPEKPAKPQGNGSKKSNGNVISSRQYAAILALAEKGGYSEAQVKTRILDAYGTPVEKLDRRTASEVITELNNKVNGNGRAAGGAA